MVPQSEMDDTELEKILIMLEQTRRKGGEDRLLSIVRGIAKDIILSAAQAIRVARLFTNAGYQKKAHKMLYGNTEAQIEIPSSKKEKVTIRAKNDNRDVFSRNMNVSDSLLEHRSIKINTEEAHNASSAFFDLFGGVLLLTRLEDEISDEMNAETETTVRGLAFALKDPNAAFPAYDFLMLRCSFSKRPSGEIVKVDFKVIARKDSARIMLLQDQSIAANDGGSGQYSLLKLTQEREAYSFEFPSREAAQLDYEAAAAREMAAKNEDEGGSEAGESSTSSENGKRDECQVVDDQIVGENTEGTLGAVTSSWDAVEIVVEVDTSELS